MSAIGTAPYGTLNHLVEIIQPTLNKNKHGLLNSSSFINEATTWATTQEEIQVSYGVINLYPSIFIVRAITLSIDTLNRRSKHPNKINTHRYTKINGILLKQIH